MNPQLLYSAVLADGKRDYRHLLFHPVRLLGDIATATISYIEQVVYIMDPENFIIRKESNQSLRHNEKQKRSKRKLLRKTVVRPHYICLTEDETRSFLKGESTVPRPVHPVRGYWKTLMSERYVNMRGQRIHIQQYYRGEGDITGRGGWNYQVMVKESPDRIVAYRR